MMVVIKFFIISYLELDRARLSPFSNVDVWCVYSLTLTKQMLNAHYVQQA